MGVVGLVFGPAGLAVALSRTPPRKAFFAGMATLICAGLFAYHAASNEVTGTASYHRKVLAASDVVESATRDSSPARFRRATNYLLGGSGPCLGIAAAGLAFSRKCREQ